MMNVPLSCKKEGETPVLLDTADRAIPNSLFPIWKSIDCLVDSCII
jgi:hypothetical protein